MKYQCKTAVHIDMVEYSIGDVIDLDEDLAQELLKTGCVEPTHLPFTGQLIAVDNAPPANTKLGAAFRKMVGEANEIKARIHAIDEEIYGLNEQKSQLLGAQVSKADYLEFIRSDITRRGARYQDDMVKQFQRDGLSKLSYLDRIEQNNMELDLPYLLANAFPFTEVSHSAMFFLFGELIVKRLGDILDTLAWPDNLMPVSERYALLKSLGNQIAELSEERHELAAMLSSAGLVN